jgi:hypothetical protein
VHIFHAGGGSTDVRGFDGAVINMHTAANISLSARFTFTNASLAPEDPRSTTVREVRGSHLTAAYVTARAVLGGAPVLVHIELSPPSTCWQTGLRPAERLRCEEEARTASVLVKDAAGQKVMETRLRKGEAGLDLGDLAAAMPAEGGLLVRNKAWQYTAQAGTYRPALHGGAAVGPLHYRVDVGAKALRDPLASPVAPHGVIGQGFDGRHIDGKKDSYAPDQNGVFTTSAQGEGAIEGTVKDYIVASPFATEFKFGRFDKERAPPRDTSGLNAEVGPRQPWSASASLAGAAGDA